ncbi:hypothetical protein [Streptomyces longisporoflavus]|uniref:Cytotoxic translational repressor of toxin-antitoxin stability system n=1 Tax=Streptomyces longisporoflavus TaxID=28044 RepID=A0ABW7R386_9ACTN
MTYELIVPPSIRRQITDLPLSDQAELIALFDRLPAEAEQVTDPYGLEVPNSPVRMRTAGLARLIVVITLNATEVTVTVVRVYDPLCE